MFFRRRRPVDPDWQVEDVAGRLRRVLAQAGPHDDRIGHHRTQHGNTDPARTGLALVGSSGPYVHRSRRLWLTLSHGLRPTGTKE